MYDIIKTRPLVPDGVLRRLAREDVATVHEAMDRRGAMSHTIRPVSEAMTFCGRALTVCCPPGDNIMLVKAISMATKGDVIVADMGPIVDNAPFGELLALDCVSRGVAGVVLSCSVRDSAAITQIGFPVFSAGISVFGTVKRAKGNINHPVQVGGAIVYPGDVIMGDRDGVVVVPVAEAEETAGAANARREKEAHVKELIASGKSVFEINRYQETLDALGVSEEPEIS